MSAQFINHEEHSSALCCNWLILVHHAVAGAFRGRALIKLRAIARCGRRRRAYWRRHRDGKL